MCRHEERKKDHAFFFLLVLPEANLSGSNLSESVIEPVNFSYSEFRFDVSF